MASLNKIHLLSVVVLGLLMHCAQFAKAQAPSPPNVPRTIFLDSDGNSISNNEFVDIRMANPNYPDATRLRTLADGTVEFRLQKVPQEGMLAPDFAVRTIDGKTLKSEDLSGKVVVLNFWFIGWPVCRSEMPRLRELSEKYATEDEVVFVAMTADPAAHVKDFVSREQFGYQMVAGAKPAMQAFVFSGYPKNIVIGRDGRISYWRTTVKAWDKFESVVRSELSK